MSDPKSRIFGELGAFLLGEEAAYVLYAVRLSIRLPTAVSFNQHANTLLCECAVQLAAARRCTAGWQQQPCCVSLYTLSGRTSVVSC